MRHWGRDELISSWIHKVVTWIHWGQRNDRQFLDDFYKCIFLNENMWISIHWSLFQFTISSIGSDDGLAPVRRQATSHYLNQWWLVYWRIYASLGLNELTYTQRKYHCTNGIRNHAIHRSTLVLINCSLVIPQGVLGIVKNVSDNGLMPEGTKNQCLLIINMVLWHWPEDYPTGYVQDITH